MNLKNIERKNLELEIKLKKFLQKNDLDCV